MTEALPDRVVSPTAELEPAGFRIHPLAYLAAAGLWLYGVSVFLRTRPVWLTWTQDMVPIVVAIGAAYFCVVAARRSEATRTMWTLLAVGAATWAAGDTVFTLLGRLDKHVGPFSWADLGYFALIPSWSAAVLLRPFSRQRGAELLGSAVNAIMIFTAAGAITASFVLRPILAEGLQRPGTVVSLAYPAGDLVLLAVVGGVLAQAERRQLSAEIWIAAAILIFALGDIWYAYLEQGRSYESASPIDLTWTGAFTCLAVATRFPFAATPRPTRPARIRIPLPSLLGLVATLGLGVAAMFSPERAILLGGAAIVGFLLLFRYGVLIVENDRLMQELESTVHELRATNEAQEDFVAAASHQLRTPLTSIRLRLDEVHDVGPASAQGHESLREIGSEVKRLETLSSRLLTLLAGRRPSIPVRLPLATVINEAITRVSPLARSRSVGLGLPAGPTAQSLAAYADALEEVLLNVLDNAVKYTPSGGLVTVAVTDDGDVAVVHVTDGGPGIDPGVLAKVFNPFFRSRWSRDGFGLGLAIAKRLCDASGGAITIGPAAGGTVVTIWWPKASEIDEAGRPELPSES